MNKTVKTIIWGVVIAGIGVGTYFLVQNLLGGVDGDGEEDEDTGELDAPTPFESEVKKNRTRDSNRWLKKGMKDSSTQAEIEFTQSVINKMRDSARKQVNESQVMAKFSPDLKYSVKLIAGLPKLTTDGEYGSKTEAAVKIITCHMGKCMNETSLCQMRRARRAFSLERKLSDPYAKWKTICGMY